MPLGNEYKILNTVNTPDDLKKVDEKDLPLLCEEIRRFLVEKVSVTGGHLASNLGVVELSVALHRAFETPKDHIIFDVSHQSYVHKMLTERRDLFDTLRQSGGISGFTKRDESEHDAFGAGHSSTSVSAALGFAVADKLNGSDAYSIAVLGDGAFTGGMVHEAFNNLDRSLRLIVILNENEMSISKNTGRFADSLSRIRVSTGYFRTKSLTVRVLNAIPFVGGWILKLLKRVKKFFKNLIYGSNYFENMGLYYLGPVDGNDIDEMVDVLKLAKKQKDSVIIHIKTKKGKGYEPAEESPDKYHSMASLEKRHIDDFSSVFGGYLTDKASENDSIAAVTAAMSTGTGLDGFKHEHPDRFFDVGIAEEHAVTFGAGLAAAGKRPVVAIYSTFLQRAYDNIVHDVALQKLPVCLAIDRAGLNPSDGPTHHGIFDVAFLSGIPNMKIYTPATYEALRRAFDEALLLDTPTAVRYPRGPESALIKEHFYCDGASGVGIRCDFTAEDNLDAVIISHGRITAEAIKARESLLKRGITVGIILLEFLKPYSECALLVDKAIGSFDVPIITLEEEIRNGGAGMLIRDELGRRFGYSLSRFVIMAVDDNFAFGKKNEEIYESLGLSASCIEKEIMDKLGRA